MIGVGVALGSIGGLELSIREHFGGYRSHTLLLSGVASALVLAGLFYLGPASLPSAARLAIGLSGVRRRGLGLSAAFRRRAGVAFKIR